MDGMSWALYWVFFMLVAGLAYDNFRLDSKYSQKVYFEARNYAAQVLPKQEYQLLFPKQDYQLSGRSRPARPTPTN
jgi:hypothetical protein